MGEVIVALDIDQTLAGGVVQAHLGHYNNMLGLGLTEDDIVGADSRYQKTFDVPQIIEYRSRDDDGFQAARSAIRTSHDVHVAFTPIEGSVEASHGLATSEALNFGGYYTVRTPEVDAATKQWLGEKGYPDPERVVICDTPRDKIEKLIDDFLPQDQRDAGRTVVLIDDSMTALLEAARAIHAEDPQRAAALRHLLIVQFGNLDPNLSLEGVIYPETGLRTLQLPSWDAEHVARVQAQMLDEDGTFIAG